MKKRLESLDDKGSSLFFYCLKEPAQIFWGRHKKTAFLLESGFLRSNRKII